MSGAHDRGLHEEIALLARSLHSQRNAVMDVDNLFSEVAHTTVRILPNVHHAGISLIASEGRKVRSAAATGPIPKELDELQESIQQGPCVESIHEQITVKVDDYDTEERWPEFTRAAVAATPVRSSLSIQLYTHESEIGALNLYSERPGTFSPEMTEWALAVGAHAAIGVAMARRDDQFRTALASRDIIGQAKGMIMERFDVDAHHAFRLLVRLSQERNTPLHTVAEQLVHRGHPAG